MPAVVPTHRFTLSNGVVAKLNEFARTELTGSKRRSEMDALWQRFVAANTNLFDSERERLRSIGYAGDLNTKMYRSVLYYRKPNEDGSERRASGEPQARREYIATPADLLPIMDEHIETHCFGDSPLSPAAGWAHFQQHKSADLEAAQVAITGSDLLTSEEALAKLKKTYKNRQFLQRKRRQQEAVVVARLEA